MCPLFHCDPIWAISTAVRPLLFAVQVRASPTNETVHLLYSFPVAKSNPEKTLLPLTVGNGNYLSGIIPDDFCFLKLCEIEKCVLTLNLPHSSYTWPKPIFTFKQSCQKCIPAQWTRRLKVYYSDGHDERSFQADQPKNQKHHQTPCQPPVYTLAVMRKPTCTPRLQ